MSPVIRLTGLIFAANVGSMAGSSTFAALAPRLAEDWRLTNTEIGWIVGVYYGGYALVVPVLVALTDRMDSRRIHLASAGLGAAAFVCFGWLAQGFWSALALHAVAGAALAGTYMPGLRMLTDRLDGPTRLRAVAYYTPGFSFGIALSFFVSGLVEDWGGWRLAFLVAGCGNLSCVLLVLFGVTARPMTPTATGARHLLDFRPALRNRAAMGFTLGYVGHSYELMAVRGWLVVFLAFAESLQPEAMRGWNLTLIASLAVLAGMPSSILGGELALRYGRKRLVSWVMAATVLAALAAGVSASLPFPVVIALVVIYNVMIMGDSAALTAGALGGARPGEQGATLAVHSLAGFSASFVGPLAVGVTLDLAGGNTSATAWIWAFAAMGAGSALGLVLLRWIAVEAEKN
jgi:MFS family permease